MTVEELVNILATMDPKALVLRPDFSGDNTRTAITYCRVVKKTVGPVRRFGTMEYREGHGRIPAVEIG